MPCPPFPASPMAFSGGPSSGQLGLPMPVRIKRDGAALRRRYFAGGPRPSPFTTMGNMLTFMLGTTAVVDHCHPRQLHPGASSSSRIAGRQFEPLSILAFRAMSEHIVRCKAFRRERIADRRFQLLSILVCGAIHAEGITAADPFKLCGILICGVLSDYICHDAEEPTVDLLGDLPEINKYANGGAAVPIDLSKSSELKCANIWYFGDTLEHTITVLAKVLTSVQHLTLNAGCKSPEIPCLMSYPVKFSRMTYLQLSLHYVKEFDSLSLVSFLRSAPLTEKLELHFFNAAYVRLVQEPEPIRNLSKRLFNSMKSLHITGFEACKGEVEFLVHMVENAPALELLCIDHSYQYPLGFHKDKELDVDLLHTSTRRHLKGKISPNCTLILL